MAEAASARPSAGRIAERAAGGTAAEWWNVAPRHQVSHLAGVDPELLALAVDPLPAPAPVVVRYRPRRGGPLRAQVTAVLDELDSVAGVLFPRWLPGAERYDGTGLLGVAAVRARAAELAARSDHFGPFLAELAVRSLAPRSRRTRSGFPDEVRAAGLTRVLGQAYGRDAVVLLIDLPEGLTAYDEGVLVAAAEWLAARARLTVWLAGGPLRAVDRVRSVVVSLPAGLTRLRDEAGPGAAPSAPGLTWPAPAGAPRADSAAEQTLERALAPHGWAGGRRWNQVYDGKLLGRPYRLDLHWPADGVVVEVDGPEHRGRLAFADDRWRDVQLQLLGLDVLRFTNEQVLADVQLVVEKIRQLLVRRRADDTHR
jgi:very-short-patch-repair endonuclease